MAVTGWTLEGTSLRDFSVTLKTIDGWDSFPGKRGGNSTVPFVHGEYSVPRKFYEARDLGLVLEVLPYQPAGGQTVTTLEHLQTNVDKVLGLLHSRDSLLTLSRTMPDASVRQLEVEVINAVPVLTGQSKFTRQIAVQFRAPNPFWRETPINTVTQIDITTTSQNIAVVTGGNAPIHDAVIRFTATAAVTSPKLSWPSGATPEYVSYVGTVGAGDWIEFDCGARTAYFDDGSRADSGVDFAYAHWIELPPADSFNMTATCGSASDWDVSINWYDKWF